MDIKDSSGNLGIDSAIRVAYVLFSEIIVGNAVIWNTCFQIAGLEEKATNWAVVQSGSSSAVSPWLDLTQVISIAGPF